MEITIIYNQLPYSTFLKEGEILNNLGEVYQYHWLEEQQEWQENGTFFETKKDHCRGVVVVITLKQAKFSLCLLTTPQNSEVDVEVELLDLNFVIDEMGINYSNIHHEHDEITNKVWFLSSQLLNSFIQANNKEEFEKYLPLCLHYAKVVFSNIVRIWSERISPTNKCSTNNPSINACCNNSSSEKRCPIRILSSREEEISCLVNDDVNKKKKETIAIRSENNT